MKNTTLLIALLLGFLGMAQSTATYDVTFTSNWSQTTHPHSSGSLPANAHWSKLVGVTHDATISFWELGALASPGIEDVAELGNNTVFFSVILDFEICLKFLLKWKIVSPPSQSAFTHIIPVYSSTILVVRLK